MFEVGPEMVTFVSKNIAPDAFQFPQARAAFDLAVHRMKSGEPWDVPAILNSTEDQGLRNFIAEVLSTRYEISRGWAEFNQTNPLDAAEQSIIRMKVEDVERHIAENVARLKEAKKKGEDVVPLMEENLRLQLEKKTVVSTRLLGNPTADENKPPPEADNSN